MSSLFSYEDIFVAGIGFDIAGAYLLARGLIQSPPRILILSSSFFGFNPAQVVARIEDKVSAYFGVSTLVLGFLAQLVGYVLDLALRSAPPASPARAYVAVGVAASAIAVVIGVYRSLRRPLGRRAIFDIAHFGTSGKQPDPYGHSLKALGTAFGYPTLESESDQAYAKRVWHVDKIIEGDPSG